MHNSKINWQLFIWIAIAGLFIFATFNRHSRSKIYTYNSQLMSDKAGYYVYLPAFFIYNFDAKKLPDNIDSLTGYGFYINKKDNKIQSKYPIGTAILECPFFLLAHLYEKIWGDNPDGFNKTYQNFIDISAVVYLLLGMFFLNLFLIEYYSKKIVILSLFLIFFGTNLYYYCIFEGGYSHVYSFFLFSLFIYLLRKDSSSVKTWIGLVITSTLIVLVRQINIIFWILTIIALRPNLSLFKNRKPLEITISLFLAILFLVPQIVYNYYLTGGPFFYSYQNEYFIYWTNPKIKEVLFGFENGWITTNPIHLFTLIGLVLVFKKNKYISIGTLCIAAVCTYLYASWWAYDLGCAYGHRGFVDIYPVLTMGLAEFCFSISMIKIKWLKRLIHTFVFLLVMLNLKFIYTYDSCWPNSTSVKDFEIYLNFLTSPTK